MLKQEIWAIFHGEVQGVGFRATAKRFADQLNITGHARNMSDGTVEIVAQGTKKDLDAFLQQLKIHFDIDDIALNTHTPEEDFQGFHVR